MVCLRLYIYSSNDTVDFNAAMSNSARLKYTHDFTSRSSIHKHYEHVMYMLLYILPGVDEILHMHTIIIIVIYSYLVTSFTF